MVVNLTNLPRHDPLRIALLLARPFFFGTNRRPSRGDRLMAVHTEACRRDTRVTTFFRGVMTVETRHLQLADVEPMGERDRLRRLVPLVLADQAIGRRLWQPQQHTRDETDYEDDSQKPTAHE